MTGKLAAPRVGVVVVTYNGGQMIERCLGSLGGEAVPLRVIVVDNASDDATTATVRDRFPGADLVASTVNTGFGAGNNVGISRALALGCEYVFLLNQDAWIAPGALDRLVEAMDRNPAYGAASPLHCTADFSGLDPRTTANYIRPYALEFLSDAALRTAKDVYKTRGVNAAAWLVRCSTWLRCGGFDPLFFMYSEDDDLLDRWAQHGVPFALVPSSHVAHARLPSAAPRIPEKLGPVAKAARKLRSPMVLDVKRMKTAGYPGTRTIVLGGVAAAFASWLERRDTQALSAALLACWQTWRERKLIARHAALCMQPGPHFLDVAGIDTQHLAAGGSAQGCSAVQTTAPIQ